VNIVIGSRIIAPGQPCFIMAEVGLAHDGSLSQAHAYIEACAKAGADAVKFQCHDGDPTSEWRVPPLWPQDRDRAAYWKRTGFTGWDWLGLKEHCYRRDVEFLCSPFSVQAVSNMDALVPAWKVPSGRIADTALLDAVAATGKPAILSTGMATEEEISQAERRLRARGSQVGVMQCTSLYPCPAEDVGLAHVVRWGGLSDHSGTIYPGIAATALGCQMLEVHVCFSKAQGGLDCEASLTLDQFAELVDGVRFVQRALRPVSKDVTAESLDVVRRVFMGGGCA
jgi:N-acetylneuraminate synthase